jgi:three-Cys-motif partner protein
VTPPFDRLVFSDVEPANVEALTRRIPSQDRTRVELHTGDCHEVARRVVGDLSHRALALAFVDPEGFEVKFRLFQILATRRIDILYLFPGGIGVARNLGVSPRASG